MSYNRTVCLLTLKSQNLIGNTDHSLYAESHDGVNDVVVVLPESLDGLLAGNACLCHDELNVLGLKASLINLLTIIFLFLFLLILLGGLALAENLLLVVVTGVVAGSLGGSELLSGGSLGLGVQVLNLGLTEDARWELVLVSVKVNWFHIHPAVGVGGAVDLGLVDNEEDL
jgi:hypothetical protein